MEANVSLNRSSNAFLISPRFRKSWKVLRLQRGILAVVRNFAGEHVADAGDAFTNTIIMIRGNEHQSFKGCELAPVEAGLDLIVTGGWWLTDYQLSNPHDFVCSVFPSSGCIDQ